MLAPWPLGGADGLRIDTNALEQETWTHLLCIQDPVQQERELKMKPFDRRIETQVMQLVGLVPFLLSLMLDRRGPDPVHGNEIDERKEWNSIA